MTQSDLRPQPIEWNGHNDASPLGDLKDTGWRELPDLLRLWQLCDRAACRRARSCRGDVCGCLAASKGFMPPHVRAWYAGMEKAERGGQDDVMPANPEALESAAIAWRAALRAAAAFELRRRRGGAKHKGVGENASPAR